MANKSTSKTKSKQHSYTSQSSKYLVIPIILILAVLPLIMHYHLDNPDISSYSWASQNSSTLDFFLHYKQIFFLIISAVMLVLIILNIKKSNSNFKDLKLFIPLLLLGVLNLLSTITSETAKYGYWGIFDQFESVFTLISYSLIVIYCYLYIKKEEDLAYLLHYFMIGVLVIVFIGSLQAIGHDFLATEIGKKLYLPRTQWSNLAGYTMSFGKNRTYMTLFNPNYVGVYVSMLIPFILCLLITEKTKKALALYSTILLGLIISLLGSESKTSIICIIATIPFLLFFFRAKIFTNKKISMITTGFLLVGILIISLTNFSFIKNTFQSFTNITKSTPNLTDIKTDKLLTITYKGNNLNIDIKLEDTNYNTYFYDEKESILASHKDESGQLIIDDERFQGITAAIGYADSLAVLQLSIDGTDWNFTNQLGDDTFYYINKYGKLDKIVQADSAIFTGYENYASGRGYIWSRSIPLLKDRIILGEGANSYVFAFPQQDYVNLYNSGFGDELLTKPHSFYLQLGIQSGLLALISFLVFYIIYFVWSIRLYKNIVSYTLFTRTGIASFIATIGFMLAGITNDSSMAVSPVFWSLLGIGIACNAYNASQIPNSTKGK
ncbi:O-antigen ligase family protein [Anaerocolumna sp. AGMB13020]|uniref:O-antigen ligase family protein n=1 Tax=Anaerocolumna sp. AGMB13020 TaxID=3081750 RepID=UPI0029550F03|nr:O-antigen ligase family protein [Anaerocolumna sp. AGMB13020]WOO35442.1 O-antigen ligase family protein [Anaerocolumna sp. AGMB13020]